MNRLEIDESAQLQMKRAPDRSGTARLDLLRRSAARAAEDQGQRKISAATGKTRGMEELGGMEKSPDRFAQGGERNRFAQDTSTAAGWDPVTSHQERQRPVSMITGMVSIHLFDEARSLVAAHLRHDAVEDNEIEDISAKFFQSFAAARRRRYHVSIAAQISGNDLEDTRFIINDEDTER